MLCCQVTRKPGQTGHLLPPAGSSAKQAEQWPSSSSERSSSPFMRRAALCGVGAGWQRNLTVRFEWSGSRSLWTALHNPGCPPVSKVRSGVAYILRKHAGVAATSCPALNSKRVSPHVLRHSCGTDVFRATRDIPRVTL